MPSPDWTPTRLSFNAELSTEVFVRKPANPSRAILLLHGYSETGRRILRKLEPHLPADALLISPNAPFPVPVRGEGPDGFREGFAWYFYSPATDEYLIDMTVGLRAIFETMQTLSPPALPIEIIGFSQGAYIAPFAGFQLPKTRQVITIAGRWLAEELPGSPSFKADGVHGEDDPVVSAVDARASHAELLRRGAYGEFTSVPGVGHRIDERIGAEIARKLSHL